MTKGKKALSLCIMRILEKYASAQDPINTRRIIEYLESDYELTAERKAVGRNLALLSEMGFDLCDYHENGKGYYLRPKMVKTETAEAVKPQSHEAEPLPEQTRMVILDALLRAPGSDIASELIGKLQSDVPVMPVAELNRSLNTQVFDKLELIRRGIREGKRINYVYNSIAADGSLTPQRSSAFSASPYALFLAEEEYYVIVAIVGYGKPLHYRVDLMSELSLTNEPAREVTTLIGCESGLDVERYVEFAVYRHRENERFTLLCARHLIGELHEAFFGNVNIVPEGDNVRVSVSAPWSAVRRFVLKNLKHAILLTPADRRAELRNELTNALSCYPRD
ncbi:MAG TPA: WYL domain-containing protein [Clostridia bacterium]|nr:WYL domain-containing protein [Clostridia bacterium]